MSERKILDMLESGVIDTEDAARLLNAVAAQSEPADSPPQEGTEAPEGAPVEPDEVLLGDFSDQADRWKRWQWVPLGVSVSLLVVASWGLWQVHRAADGGITFGWVVLLLVVLGLLAATALSAWIVNVPWLHVRVAGADGHRIAISLPLPIGLLGLGVRIAQRFVGDEASAYLDMSAEMLHSLRQTGGARQPVDIRVDEGGEQVRVYIG